MRTKKIRGHKRRWKDINRWIESNKNLDLSYIHKHQRNYSKIWIDPWCGISITKNQIAEPTGISKNRILKGLIEIYDNWKQELDKLGESYYLKIWLFEPRFSNSQVVCAIGDSLEYYENMFFEPNKPRELNLKNFGRLETEISKFNWDYRLDEDHFDNSEPGSQEMYETKEDFEEEKRWYEKMLKKPHRTVKFDEPIGEATESYSFKKGDVWLGEK